MNSLSQYPLVRLVLPFATGIVGYLVFGLRFSFSSFIIAYVSFFVVLVVAGRFFQSNFSRRWAFGVWTVGLFLVLGYHVAQEHNQLYKPGHFSHLEGHSGKLLLRISEPISEKTNSYQVLCKVEGFVSDSVATSVGGKLMLYLQKDSLAAGLRYGDFILIENSFQQLSPPKNPSEFNYSRFLSYKNIFHQAYRASGQWHGTGQNRGSFVLRWSDTIRQKALQIFESNFQGAEFAIITALFLGYKEYLDENLRREFVGAGAMHILCVSGLHVGIIFLVLKMFFAFLLKLPRGKFLRAIAIIMVMWLYAAITGFSPSVLRACTMFSFVAMGQSFNRKTNIYNTLAASALVLLLVDPYIVASVGFQLSYLAVISIVALQPYLYKQLVFKNWFFDKAWAIITVSLAAQLATGPLSLFYFNQFPNYFLIANLVVIPLAGVIIYSAIATLVMYPIPFLGVLAGKALYIVLLALHQSVKFIEGLPHSTTTNFFVSLPEMLSMFLVIVLVSVFLMGRRKMALIFALCFGLFLSVSTSVRGISRFQQQRMVVYHVNNSTAIDFISGRNSVMLMSENLIENPGRINFHISQNRIELGISKVVEDVLSSGNSSRSDLGYFRNGNLLRFGPITAFVLDRELTGEIPPVGIEVDCLLVTGNGRQDPEKAIKAIAPAKVIVDASNSFWTNNLWVEACQKLGVECWSVRNQGAYVWEMK